MEKLNNILIIFHAIAGFTAFFIGPIAIFTDKFGRVHKQVGRVFAIAMAIVFVTAVVVSIYKGNAFLFMVGVFSFYSVFSGVRILRLKKLHTSQKAQWYDWAIHGVFIITCFAFMAYAGLLFHKIGAEVLPILCSLFGVGGLFSIRANLRPFFNKKLAPNFWLDYHRANMIGAYIATVTAFSAQNLHFLPGLVQWIWPTLIILPLSSFFNKKYNIQKEKPTQ